MRSRPAVLMYCQHSLGLGHLKRSWVLAEALARHFDVVMLVGGVLPHGIGPPDRVRVVALPPLALSDDGELSGGRSADSVDRILDQRRTLVLQTLRAVSPAVLISELYPFGRKKFASELTPLLAEARRAVPRPLVVCSLRDILVSRGLAQQQHDDEVKATAEGYFDAVLVHADPALARFEDSFRPSTPLAIPVHYTGFVVGRAPRHVARVARRQELLVSAGGGRVGGPLFAAAVGAAAQIHRDCRLRVRIVAGPLYPEDQWASLCVAARRSPVSLCRSVGDLGRELSMAAASVSQCGYNTALEIVWARTPAIVVPFGEPPEDEQMTRAQRLERLGLVRVIEPHRLDAASLADSVARLSHFTPARARLDMNGARNTRLVLSRMLHGERP